MRELFNVFHIFLETFENNSFPGFINLKIFIGIRKTMIFQLCFLRVARHLCFLKVFRFVMIYLHKTGVC